MLITTGSASKIFWAVFEWAGFVHRQRLPSWPVFVRYLIWAVLYSIN
jgi:hypothetical protein